MTPSLSPARMRVLRAVDALGPAPVTLADVAARLGGHANTSRRQLDALVADGLLGAAPLPSPGPGRHPRGFRVTAAGREALGHTGDEYRGLVGAFAAYLVGRPEAEAREVGRVWGAAKAVPPDAGVAAQASDRDHPTRRLIEVLDTLGFESAPIETETGGSGVVLRACPLLDAAGDHPEVMCELHRGMVDGVLRRLGAADGVTLVPFAEPAGCHLIRPAAAPK